MFCRLHAVVLSSVHCGAPCCVAAARNVCRIADPSVHKDQCASPFLIRSTVHSTIVHHLPWIRAWETLTVLLGNTSGAWPVLVGCRGARACQYDQAGECQVARACQYDQAGECQVAAVTIVKGTCIKAQERKCNAMIRSRRCEWQVAA